jgi:pimeloyl-ACP methyl ester carboxylesterase
MRRRVLLAGAAAAALAACERRKKQPAEPRRLVGDWHELPFDGNPEDAQLATLLSVKQAPLLVALHGRGEAGRGLQAGARGWRDDYDLDRAHARLQEPPLRASDLLDFVRPARLDALNNSLASAPYRGLSVACPYTPALAGDEPRRRAYARFITERLLPRVRKRLGAEVAPAPARTGIDGVSMGGRLALYLGWHHPQLFGAVGALQPAIRVADAEALTALALEARRIRPQKVRLVSSDGDPFLPAVRALSQSLERASVPHQLVVTPGPHDYAWNRGPGSFEMLLWHERVLRGLPAP